MSTEFNSIHPRAVSVSGDGFRASAVPPAPAAAGLPPASVKVSAAAQRFDLEAALDELVARAAESGASLDFRIDEHSGRVVVSVLDRRDGTVLRQMPSEEALRIARNLARYEPHLIEVRA